MTCTFMYFFIDILLLGGGPPLCITITGLTGLSTADLASLSKLAGSVAENSKVCLG